MKKINKEKVAQLVNKGALLVDMRSPVNFRNGTISSAINLPLKNFLNKLIGLNRNQKIIVFAETIDDADLKSANNYADQLGFENLFVSEYKQLV